MFRPRFDNTKRVFACKIFNNEFLSSDEMQTVIKEVRINRMIASKYCIRHYETIKTNEHIFMILEYANCFDL